MARLTTAGEPVAQARLQRGFSYFLLLWWVAISGVMLAAISQHWRFERQRERELDMVARATEIQAAIRSYRRVNLPGQGAAWPRSFNDLVADHRGPVVVRHLRRVWVDPLTGRADWAVVMAAEATEATSAAAAGGAQAEASKPRRLAPNPAVSSPEMSQTDHAPEAGFRGVYSRAKGRPIRAPLGVDRYADWRFEVTPEAPAP